MSLFRLIRNQYQEIGTVLDAILITGIIIVLFSFSQLILRVEVKTTCAPINVPQTKEIQKIEK